MEDVERYRLSGSGECPSFLEPSGILLTKKCLLGSSPWNSLLAKATADTMVTMVAGAYRASNKGETNEINCLGRPGRVVVGRGCGEDRCGLRTGRLPDGGWGGRRGPGRR